MTLQAVRLRYQQFLEAIVLALMVLLTVLVIAGASWKKFPPDVQKILSDTAREMEPVALKMAADLDKQLLEKIKKTPGISVNEADKDAFIKASKPIYDEFAKDVPGGKELIDGALALGKGS